MLLDALDITEEEAAGLAELARHDLAMARHFAERAQAAEDPALANSLARSYQRAARSYRQTLALKARLKRDLQRAASEAPKPATPRDPAGVRGDELRCAIERTIWAEHEAPDWDDAYRLFHRHARRFESRLEVLQRDDGFAQQDLDIQVLDIARELGLNQVTAARWRELPNPPDELCLDWEDVAGHDPRFDSG
jgi:hypothetical protein